MQSIIITIFQLRKRLAAIAQGSERACTRGRSAQLLIQIPNHDIQRPKTLAVDTEMPCFVRPLSPCCVCRLKADEMCEMLGRGC